MSTWYFPLLWLVNGSNPTPTPTVEWTCSIVSKSNYANGDLKLTIRCPRGAPFLKGGTLIARKP